MNTRMLSDEEIIRLITFERNPKIFEVLYERHARKVYNKCYDFVKDKAIAEDLTHDVFIKAYTSLGSFNYQSKFFTWLYAVTYNYCMDYLNQRSRQTDQLQSYYKENMYDITEISEKDLFNIQVDRLEVCLDKLNPEERTLLLMKYKDGVSIKQLTEILGANESAVKMRIKRSKEKLLNLYKDYFTHNVV